MTFDDARYLRDPSFVRDQYRSENGLAARASLYTSTTGPFPGDVAFEAVAELAPRRFLEAGCGTGWFAARVMRELATDVVAIDQSERMVALARAQGVDARVADVQALPFADGEFDCAAANWMLYHVADLDAAIRELARVLRPSGRLVAVTNAEDHLLELWRLVGAEEQRRLRDLGFGAENGEALLRRHFSDVEVRDASGTVHVEDRDAVVRYLESTEPWRNLAAAVPRALHPFDARRSTVVFVATK